MVVQIRRKSLETPLQSVTVNTQACKESVNVLIVKGSLGFIFCNSEPKDNSNSDMCQLGSRDFPVNRANVLMELKFLFEKKFNNKKTEEF